MAQATAVPAMFPTRPSPVNSAALGQIPKRLWWKKMLQSAAPGSVSCACASVGSDRLLGIIHSSWFELFQYGLRLPWQRKMESCAVALLAPGPNAPTMTLNNVLHNRKSQAGPSLLP